MFPCKWNSLIMEVGMQTKQIKLVIVDDHAMVRKGMRAFLAEFDDIQVIGEASDGWKAVELIKQFKPDVVLLDLFMPGMDGIETIQRLMTVQPQLGIIILTAFAKEDKVVEAIKAGALGYVVKDAQPEELVQSIRLVSTGTPAISPGIAWKILQAGRESIEKTARRQDLSERETEVLRLLTKGKTDQEIASQLVLSDVTIRTHVNRILTKLGLQNRVQAALYCVRSGMVSLEETYDLNEVYS
jgi:two-component system, NarL family, response regulator LiaR